MLIIRSTDIFAIPEYVIALLFAAWFTDRKLKVKGRGIFKILFYMPSIITGAAIGALFASIFGYPKGAANNFCNVVAGWFGIARENYNFFSHEWSVKWIIIGVNVFMYFGSTMVLIIAAIMGIDVEVFEAAEIDGANRLQTFFRVTIPCMREVLIYILVMSSMGGRSLCYPDHPLHVYFLHHFLPDERQRRGQAQKDQAQRAVGSNEESCLN